MARPKTPATPTRRPRKRVDPSAPAAARARILKSQRNGAGQFQFIVPCDVDSHQAIVDASYKRTLVREWWELYDGDSVRPFRGHIESSTEAHQVARWQQTPTRVVHVRRYRIVPQPAQDTRNHRAQRLGTKREG